ncbi:MAG: S-layer homology domain-containing protein [Clostridia bacterium]|nr:S-layer homology domain-containing protein [Clostridia bacterium]
MKKRRLLAFALCLALVLTSALTPAFAAGFSDVDNDPTVSWAQEAIQKMANSGYIKGYEDGTFRPYRSISKIECLILMARILGVEESAYKEVAAAAKDLYGAVASKQNSTYANELAYLLYNGILQESDLSTYASSSNANTELQRYQAAILMSKLLGANTEAKSFSVAAPTYPDDAEIPVSAKAYVEYVTEQDIMNGMASTDGSATVFSPNTSLTRAQMATLLSRMITKINKTTYTATVTDLDLKNNSISVERNGSNAKRTINADTVVYLEGEKTTVSDLQKDDNILVVEINGHVQTIVIQEEVIDESQISVVYGKISLLHSNSTTNKKITIADPEDLTKTTIYQIADDCTYTVSGAKATYGDLKKNQFVRITLTKDKITAIEVTDSSFVVNGTLASVDFDDENNVFVSVNDANNTKQSFEVSIDGAMVVRNGEEAEYRALSIGDTVKLTITYGKITRITATSSTDSFSGILREIHITATPYLVIQVDGELKEFKLRSDAVIKVSGNAAELYDLRRNVSVTGTLDSGDIKTISSSTTITGENGEITGVVAGVNSNYRVINLEDENGMAQSIYYNAKTTFLKSNGNATNAKAIELGSTVSVTGVEKNGVFEATIVIVK